jgi:transcription elongation factor GreA
MAEEVVLTKEGYEELDKRLEYLKVTKRAEITERIKTAREFGDLSENAEYDAAKNEQAMIEGEILEIEDKLKKAKIITAEDKKEGVVSLGCTVSLYDKEFDENVQYQIVGTTEADPKAKPVARISNESPIGKAVLGKKKGEVVLVDAPDGIIEMKILEIK